MRARLPSSHPCRARADRPASPGDRIAIAGDKRCLAPCAHGARPDTESLERLQIFHEIDALRVSQPEVDFFRAVVTVHHARQILSHPIWCAGQATDIEITVKEIRRIKSNLYTIIAEHTGQDIKKVADDCERDYWMIAEEAKEYGIVDEVLTKNPKKDEKK